jgi:hypothetical protein
MPVYEYLCPANMTAVEVLHPMTETVETWGRLCELAGIDPGNTPPDTSVEKQLHAPGIATPRGDSDLKSQGFTKLVRRDKGVYENVTRTGEEKRYMKADDPSSLPNIHKKISD